MFDVNVETVAGQVQPDQVGDRTLILDDEHQPLAQGLRTHAAIIPLLRRDVRTPRQLSGAPGPGAVLPGPVPDVPRWQVRYLDGLGCGVFPVRGWTSAAGEVAVLVGFGDGCGVAAVAAVAPGPNSPTTTAPTASILWIRFMGRCSLEVRVLDSQPADKMLTFHKAHVRLG
ncbi:hypothetical protein GCM10009835_04200 [Planosporangium flavigriseum]|uniref:Uncharacterized protein n=1 Tax=Planosporangium flavigriseum TaxID=373681 RepID=A0A8J3PNE8_9ACTN|nr:hypothetical protein Pfl04_49350 [Planosporangium flavigriseum]